jgi:hypothetical protein
MRKLVLLFIGVGLFWACGEKLMEPPENLIPKDSMVLIIKDMAVLNAAKTTNLGKLREYGIEPTDYVFEKYKIDSAQFVASDRYYASLPLEYEALYARVEELLEKETEIMSQQKRVNDSIQTFKNAKDSPGDMNGPQ